MSITVNLLKSITIQAAAKPGIFPLKVSVLNKTSLVIGSFTIQDEREALASPGKFRRYIETPLAHSVRISGASPAISDVSWTKFIAPYASPDPAPPSGRKFRIPSYSERFL